MLDDSKLLVFNLLIILNFYTFIYSKMATPKVLTGWKVFVKKPKKEEKIAGLNDRIGWGLNDLIGWGLNDLIGWGLNDLIGWGLNYLIGWGPSFL